MNKKLSPQRNMTRNWILPICMALAVLISATTLFRGRAASPGSGSIAPTLGASTTWMGDSLATGATGGEDQCIDSGPAKNCDSFALTVSGNPSDWIGKLVRIKAAWTNGAHDYDLYIHKGDLTGPVAASGTNGGQPGTDETAYLDPANAGVGLYTVHVAYAVVTPGQDIYSGTALVVPGLTPATQGSGLAPRFQNHYPQMSLITAGKGVDAGEPSVGVNWISGKAMYISYLTTFRVTFDDSCPTTPTSTWEDKSAPNNADSLDPILFTDHGYNNQTPIVGRTFASELSGQDSLTSYTDNDGDTWVPSQGGGIPSGVDHQTIGGGPFHSPLVGTVYPNAVYYCSQDLVTAFCARSDNGGLTFGGGVPIYSTNTSCVGIHGHVKVGPDGTVYVPNRSCNNLTTVVVSEDNGVNWTIRNIPGSNTSSSDPAVAVGRGDIVNTGGLTPQPIGRLYAAFGSSDSIAGVSVSDDRGATWQRSFDVGSLAGIRAVAFPAIVAGDDNRAAYAFLGSTTSGAPDDKAFSGLWHLYIATTYDGGQTWLVSDATPNDPVQRNGIHLGGGSPPHRNLLDFIGIDIDKEGRVLVAYADGCTGPACVQAPGTATGNSYTEIAAIARQSGGRRMFAANDPAEPTAPGAPSLTIGRDAGVAKLTWSESDNGGSAITNYAVSRGTTSGGEAFLANAGTANSYNDATADPNITYYYNVAATNAQGNSCGSNEVKSVPLGDSQCAGLKEVIDPAGDQKSAPTNGDLDVLELRLADNIVATKQTIVFRIKVSDLSSLLPNREWRVLWNYPIPPDTTTPFTGSYYLGMNTDNTGVPSFEYGTVTTVESVPANTAIPNKIGAADSGSVDQSTGVITIVLAADKVGNPEAGDIIGSLIARTFAGNADQTLRSNSAIDTTNSLAAQDPFTGMSYQIVGNAVCPLASPSPTPSPSPSPSPSPGAPTVVQFGAPSYQVTEGCAAVTVTVLRSGPTVGSATVDYQSSDGSAVQKSDYEFAGGTLTFDPGESQKSFDVLSNEDSYQEGAESFTITLSNPTGGAILGPDSSTIINITDDDTSSNGPNPIDDDGTFVCQHYHDFLNRQGEASGQNFWTSAISSCGADANCRKIKRVSVSQAFFLSVEYQKTGYLVIRIYKSAFGDVKAIPRYIPFLTDTQEIGRGVVVGQGNWQQQLEDNTRKYTEEFVARSDFQGAHGSQDAPTYVDSLFANAGVTPTQAERDAAIAAFGTGDTPGRARALRSVADSNSVFNKLYNPALVLAEYFGYLRRNPDDAPNTDFSGYDFWLAKLNRFSEPGEDVTNEQTAIRRIQRAQMIQAFINSPEYRNRFGAG